MIFFNILYRSLILIVVLICSVLILDLSAISINCAVKLGCRMPNIYLPDTNGRVYNLQILMKNKVSLVVYWSISCSHCRTEIGRFIKLAERFQESPFVLILINTDGIAMRAVISAYVNEQCYSKPILMDVGSNDSLPFAEAFDLTATPGVLIFDRTAKLILLQELKINLDMVSRIIESNF